MAARRLLGGRNVLRYTIVVLTTAGIIALRGFLSLVGHPAPFMLFFPAILASGWWWGRRPALLCVALCALASGYLWTTGGTNFRLDPTDVIDLTSFILVGTILAFMSAGFRDARRRAEAARRQLARFLESTGDAFMAFDREWHYMYVNPRAAQFARLPAESMVGHSLLELFPDITTGRFFQAAERVMRERLPVSVDSYYAPLDTWFENDIYPVEDGIGVFYRDVTARKRAAELAEELLRREQIARSESDTANRIKDEFLATLSHELRTPLNAIIGWASLLGSGRLSSGDTSRAVETILRNARAQTHLVEDLLDVSRIISGKLRLDVQPVELGPVLDAALDAVRPAAHAKELRLQIDIDPEAAVVTGDPPRLQQIAWNLLSNAIKFTPRGGRVQVTLLRVGSQAELTVRDTGIGIAPHMLTRIFDRFAQADSSSTREYHGLGLGLSLVRHLVDAHGGSVSAASPGEGQGATFTVYLPLHTAILDSPDAARIRDASSLTASGVMDILRDVDVLIVDDDRDAGELLVRMLVGMGARGRSVASAREAIIELDRKAPDVLLSDIEMPGEDGYALIRKVRGRSDRTARIPAVAVTAYARADDRARALREGFDNHIAKPVDPPELAAVVTMALMARRPGGFDEPRITMD
ncbi:MAG TPA: ATP-binding protein [Vicinamibacterales bacterium]|nr:ATP-binding protein [Vicinamibacterales bacterium]